MKKILLAITGLFITCLILAQTPQAFKYQAVVRDNTGNLMTEQTVNFQIDILKGTVSGSTVYSETHAATTSELGLVNLDIGEGTSTDDFSAIEWNNDSYFIKIWVNGDEMGTSQLLSVPYALHARSAEVFTGDEIKNIKDPTEDQDVATKAYVDRQITYPGVRIQGVVDSIDCFGANTGAIDLTITGGTAPYLFEWDNGTTTEDLTGLAQGKYQVYVEDANGMTAFRHFTLHTPEEIVITFEADAVAGDIDLTVSGGTAPYVYVWSNGSTDEDQSGLAPGSYSVQVTDALGCTTYAEFMLGGTSQQLAVYLESAESPTPNYVNTGMPAIKTADHLRSLMLLEKVYIIDIRSAEDYSNGHIEGAVNVHANEVLNHMEGVDLSAYDEISIVDYSGLTSSWVTCLLQLMGYDNVYALKFGMASWHENFAGPWNNNVSNMYAAQFTTDDVAKGPEGDMPEIMTAGNTMMEILEARVDEIFAEGFSTAAISASTVFGALDSYYIISYWPQSDYVDMGHIPGAMQYTPKADIALDAALTTLPTDKTIVVYDYTGMTSSNLVAYLRVLGYDAKSLKFGANGMIYDDMTKSKWSEALIMDYPYVAE